MCVRARMHVSVHTCPSASVSGRVRKYRALQGGLTRGARIGRPSPSAETRAAAGTMTTELLGPVIHSSLCPQSASAPLPNCTHMHMCHVYIMCTYQMCLVHPIRFCPPPELRKHTCQVKIGNVPKHVIYPSHMHRLHIQKAVSADAMYAPSQLQTKANNQGYAIHICASICFCLSSQCHASWSFVNCLHKTPAIT